MNHPGANHDLLVLNAHPQMTPPVRAEPCRLASRCARLKPSAVRQILKATANPEVISFAGGLPAPELFPVDAIRAAADEALEEDGVGSLQYGVTEGYVPLREWVCGHLAETTGLRPSPERVLITQGSQQGLDLLSRVMLDPGDTVLVENPSYVGALQTFASYEARIAGVPSDVHGLRPDALRRALEDGERRPKFIYLIPNFRNPTGTSLSAARRRTIAALADEFGVPLVEDDPYGLLRYSGEPLPALASLGDPDNRIYLGTASKILSPGLRVAWLAAPPSLFERLVSAKQASDLHTSSFTQRLVWRYVRRPGALEDHIGRLRTAYRRRRDAMLQALERHLPAGCRWTRPDGGLFLWAEAPAGIDTLELFQDAAARGVAFVPGEPFWVDRGPRHTLRLNFSNASEERIEEGVRRLGEAIRT